MTDAPLSFSSPLTLFRVLYRAPSLHVHFYDRGVHTLLVQHYWNQLKLGIDSEAAVWGLNRLLHCTLGWDFLYSFAPPHTDRPPRILEDGGQKWFDRILFDLLRQQDWILFLGQGLAWGAFDQLGLSNYASINEYRTH